MATTRRGKLAADLLQVQRRVTIYSRLSSKSPKGMAVGKRSPGHHIEAPEQRDRLPAVARQRLTRIDEYPDRRDFAPAHLCDYFASGRRQDHADREIAAVWRGDTAGGRGQGAGRAAAGALGLDGSRARARHFGLLGGDELRA